MQTPKNHSNHSLKQVALESTVISHGLPYPDNLKLAHEMERIIRDHGAVPATVGVINGELIAGLSPQQIERLAALRRRPGEETTTIRGERGGTRRTATVKTGSLRRRPATACGRDARDPSEFALSRPNPPRLGEAQTGGDKQDSVKQSERQVGKVSRRDLPVVVARKLDGATTVAATMWIAHRAGIELFATGGIGGVHRSRGPGPSADVSADLQELAQTPVIVVCAGAKALLDLPATLEYLETHGVTVIGYGTDEFPAFYSRSSGLPVDICCNTPQEVADIWRAKRGLDLAGGLLVAVPVPEEDEIPAAQIEPQIEQALAECEAAGLRSADVTPYLLRRIAELTGDRSLRANLALLRNNARVAAAIAVALEGE